MDYSLEELALVLVGRWCLFLGIGAVGLELNFSLSPALILKITGEVSLLTSLALFAGGFMAPQLSCFQSGVWEMLNPTERPHSAPVAQRMIITTLRRAFLTYAMRAAEGAAGLLAASLLV
jgi:hypothetical protein